jgi:hypothetical protein
MQHMVSCQGSRSVAPDQQASAEGFKFELLAFGWLDESLARDLLTSLGDISMSATLGHDHTIDVSGVMPAGFPAVVRLREYSRTSIGGQAYGLYEVVDAKERNQPPL